MNKKIINNIPLTWIGGFVCFMSFLFFYLSYVSVEYSNLEMRKHIENKRNNYSKLFVIENVKQNIVEMEKDFVNFMITNESKILENFKNKKQLSDSQLKGLITNTEKDIIQKQTFKNILHLKNKWEERIVDRDIIIRKNKDDLAVAEYFEKYRYNIYIEKINELLTQTSEREYLFLDDSFKKEDITLNNLSSVVFFFSLTGSLLSLVFIFAIITIIKKHINDLSESILSAIKGENKQLEDTYEKNEFFSLKILHNMLLNKINKDKSSFFKEKEISNRERNN